MGVHRPGAEQAADVVLLDVRVEVMQYLVPGRGPRDEQQRQAASAPGDDLAPRPVPRPVPYRSPGPLEHVSHTVRTKTRDLRPRRSLPRRWRDHAVTSEN